MIEPGDRHTLSFPIGEAKTVPNLYPESPHFRAMPPVFATGYMVGLMEWACIEALAPSLANGEGSLGTGIHVSHVAATPVGATVTVTVECQSVIKRRVVWAVVARDDQDVIGEGTHERTIVHWARFNERLRAKTELIRGPVSNVDG